MPITQQLQAFEPRSIPNTDTGNTPIPTQIPTTDTEISYRIRYATLGHNHNHHLQGAHPRRFLAPQTHAAGELSSPSRALKRFSTRPPGAISGAKTVGPALLRRFTYDMYVVTITGVTLRLFTYNMYVVTKTGVTWRRPARKAANFMPADSARQAENSAQVASDGCTSLFVAALFPQVLPIFSTPDSARDSAPGCKQS
ncbi:hypothetical protein THAOC_36734 [Thalassiosira oceanica]|uniref:Uncharacterized protein n=1 Tax=Thalassiosira oceanica TaxID=159749 RepID=K0RE04_THAOC|nr:hypothetical protein THAOC_36734 [Thalassiosira oceanica]|eukprot:EJK44707.1 hypothetical protein THAOC_36734 [Thalassiosira oceanica]